MQSRLKVSFLNVFLHGTVLLWTQTVWSGGLLVGWNPVIAELCAFGTTAGIFLEGRFKHSNARVKLLNCYAPYKDRECFWQSILDSGLLEEQGLIVGGDLNFTLSSWEVWGSSARVDPLADFFSNMLHSTGLVDMQPSHLSPTWRNGRAGSTGISKRLDRFLLDGNLLSNQCKYRSWTINSTISDHNPICLQIDFSHRKDSAPFKFNSSWLSEPDFISLIRSTWISMDKWTDSSPTVLLCDKLKNLKKVVVQWQSDKKQQLHSDLLHIDFKMSELFAKCPSQVFKQDELNILKALKLRKDNILAIEESTWRLRSQALWLNKGDKNTRFFHKFATQRRNQNTIWDIKMKMVMLYPLTRRLRRLPLSFFSLSTVLLRLKTREIRFIS
jgi:hypothetical protein